MDKKNDSNIMNIDNETFNNPVNKYKDLSSLIEYNGNFLKDSQSKMAELSNFLKLFKLLEDPQYYQTQSKEYAILLLKTKKRLEKLILQNFLFTNKNFKKEDFDIKKYFIFINLR